MGRLRMLLLAMAAMALLGAPAASPRRVSMWYAPGAYGGTDINASLDLLAAHPGVVGSLLLYCGHEVTAAPGVSDNPARDMLNQTTKMLCLDGQYGAQAGLIERLGAVGVRPEIVLNAGNADINDYRAFFRNASENVAAMVAIGKEFSAQGWHLDLEPQNPPAEDADAALFASFLATARPAFNAAGMRLTASVARWSPMLSNYSLLAPHVDRLMQMETYVADSMRGWVDGDSYGGNYGPFVEGATVHKAAPGFLCSNSSKCGDHLCWSDTPASVAERMKRLQADGVEEVALFDLQRRQTLPLTPRDFWWPLLEDFVKGAEVEAEAQCDPSRWVKEEYYKGKLLKNVHVLSPAACCAACSQAPDCWSWSYMYNRYCELNAVGDGSLEPKPGTNTTAGLKTPGPPAPPAPPAPPGPPSPTPTPPSPPPPPLPPSPPCPAPPSTPPPPHAAVPHGADAYCTKEGNVVGLAQDGAAAPLQRCFYTNTDGTPAPGNRIHVSASDSLSSAWGKAECGDTLLLDPTGQWEGFDFGRKGADGCPPDKWIWVSSAAIDELPPEGQRVTPCHAGVASLPGRPHYDCPNPRRLMPRIVFDEALQMSVSGNNIRFIGIEFGTKDDSPPVHDYVTTWGSDHVIFDRVWLRGSPTKESCCGIQAQQSNFTALIDSYSTDFHGLFDTCGDAQVYHTGTQGRGRTNVVTQNSDNVHKVVNCYLEGSAQGVMVGGGGGHEPAYDIEVRRNYFFKPWQWNPSHPDFAGIKWATKSHLECKNCVRLLAEANVFEQVWGGFGGSYGGRPILMTPKNQQGHMPNATITDITIRYNWMKSVGGFMEMINGNSACDIHHNGCKGDSCPYACPAKAGHSYSVHDCVLEDINYTSCQGCSRFWMEITSSTNTSSFRVHDISIDHITLVPAEPDTFGGGFLDLGGAPMSNINWTNSILPTGKYPAHASTTGCGQRAATPREHFADCFKPFQFDGNLLIAQQQHDKDPRRWPACNSFPQNVSAVMYDPQTYALNAASPYKGSGTDGRDPGADVPTLLAAIAGVRSGQPNSDAAGQ